MLILTGTQSNIIKDICTGQIATFVRIYNNDRAYKEIREAGFDITKSEVGVEIASFIERFEELREKPIMLFYQKEDVSILVKSALSIEADKYEEREIEQMFNLIIIGQRIINMNPSITSN